MCRETEILSYNNIDRSHINYSYLLVVNVAHQIIIIPAGEVRLSVNMEDKG